MYIHIRYIYIYIYMYHTYCQASCDSLGFDSLAEARAAQ